MSEFKSPVPTSNLAKALRQGQAYPSVQRSAGAFAASLHSADGNQPPPRYTSGLAKSLQGHRQLLYCQADALRVARPADYNAVHGPFLRPGLFKPRIINRAGWGAAPPILSRGYERITGEYSVYYDTLVIHHSGNWNNYPTMREAQVD